MRALADSAIRQSSITTNRRNPLIEALRIPAAFGIVAFHAKAPGFEAYYAGLLFFMLLSPLVDLHYRADRPRSSMAIARPLLLPWLFWMLAYAVVNLLLGRPALPDGPIVLALLMGTAPHLWFLPFLFAVMLVTDRIKRAAVTPTVLFWSATTGSALLLATAYLWRPFVAGWPAPIPQWLHVAPAVLCAIAIAASQRIGRLQAATGVIVLAVGICLPLLQNVSGVGLAYAIAVPTTAAAVLMGNWRSFASINVEPIASCMFGVYLVHLITLPLASRLMGANTTGAAKVAFGSALVGVYLTRQLIPKSRLVLG